MNNQEYQYKYISTNTTTQVFTGKGILHAIVVNTTAAGAVTIIDGTAGTTGNVGILKSSVAEGTYQYHVSISAGLRIVTAASSDITICYSQA